MSISATQSPQRVGKSGNISQSTTILVCRIGWRLFHMRRKTMIGNDEHLAITHGAIAYSFIARHVADLLSAHEACLYCDKHPINISSVSHYCL